MITHNHTINIDNIKRFIITIIIIIILNHHYNTTGLRDDFSHARVALHVPAVRGLRDPV